MVSILHEDISKLLSVMICQVLLLFVFMAVAAAMPPVSVVANVRGKKYDITAETVEEFSQQVESLAGLEANQQSVLFRGKVLDPADSLEDLGVASGDILNVLKGRKPRVPKPEENLDLGSMSPTLDLENDSFGTDFEGLGSIGGAGGKPGGFDPDMMKNMDPEQIRKSMEAMDNLLDSNFVEEYFGDEEKLENARLQMLNNMDQYEKMMPGFKEQAGAIASDPEKWKEAMQKAKEQILELKSKRDAAKRAKSDGAPNVPFSDNR